MLGLSSRRARVNAGYGRQGDISVARRWCHPSGPVRERNSDSAKVAHTLPNTPPSDVEIRAPFGDALILVDEASIQSLDDTLARALTVALDPQGRTDITDEFPGQPWDDVWRREGEPIWALCRTGHLLIDLLDHGEYHVRVFSASFGAAGLRVTEPVAPRVASRRFPRLAFAFVCATRGRTDGEVIPPSYSIDLEGEDPTAPTRAACCAPRGLRTAFRRPIP